MYAVVGLAKLCHAGGMTAEALFLRVLTLACDRLFMAPVFLKDLLRADAAGTLFTLSSRPEAFAPLNPALDDEVKKHAVLNVLTAARAYIRWLQLTAPSPSQDTLPLL